MMKKRTPARMQQLVDRWRASGESGAGFARRHGIPAWTFWYWCRKQLRGRTAVPAPSFAPVHVTGDGAVVEIVWPDGPRVQVRAGASAEVVHAVVAAVRATC